MAVRFDADGEDYTRALALGTQTALTAACWFKISVDRNDWSSVFFVDNGTSDNWGLQTGSDGVTMATVFDASTQEGMGALTIGTWYFVCLATSGTTGTLYHKTAASSGLTSVSVTSVTANVNAATLRIGESPWGAEWLNGCVAAFRFWNAQLSAAEAQLESTQYVPNRLTNLVSWHPLVRPETADYSGNGRTLSGGSGATTEDGPPIPWQVISPRLFLPAASGGLTAVLGQPSETDTAQALARLKTKAAGQVTETDTAQPITGIKARAIGQPSESDTAQPIGRVKARAIEQPGETDTAQLIGRRKAMAVGQAAETDTAQAVGHLKALAIAAAAETDTAQPVSHVRFGLLGQPSETDTAHAVAHAKTTLIALVSETDSALLVTAVGPIGGLRGSVASLPSSVGTVVYAVNRSLIGAIE